MNEISRKPAHNVTKLESARQLQNPNTHGACETRAERRAGLMMMMN
jgi:hypothetical protein